MSRPRLPSRRYLNISGTILAFVNLASMRLVAPSFVRMSKPPVAPRTIGEAINYRMLNRNSWS